ncbi:hypothetical protein [Rhizorhapis sp. SPR117]|uniref:hypothetical protein n=1 Tax=Rhizorhapis sp. SPR117 TaxID=2912611 RepID=UPI001F1A896C|nr:hypothetical protein [Rhizorhapis sp. SPR117]
MNKDIRRWAAGHLKAQGLESCHARINAVHDAVVMVLQSGRFGDERSEAIFEQAYAAYGDSFAECCRQRGLDCHPHRRIALKNDN